MFTHPVPLPSNRDSSHRQTLQSDGEYGKLGVIEKGAMADLLIYSSNPMADVAIVANPEDNLLLIMKDGKIVKNTIE